MVNVGAGSPYVERFGDQMGTTPPDVMNLTEAMANADAGAVYANRHVAEFASASWSIPPSLTPTRFEDDTGSIAPGVLGHLSDTNTDGFIIVKNGRIIVEYYGPGMSVTSKHAVHSSGKSWTSAVWHDVLLAQMGTAVDAVLPELAESVYAGERIRDLVDMRIPVHWWEDYDDPASPVVRSGAASGWHHESLDADLISFAQTLERDPALRSGDWHYVSANTMLMALAGAALAGTHPYERLRSFADRIGLEHMSGTVANLHGQYSAEGGQWLTLRDAVKLPAAMAGSGRLAGKTILSPDYLDDIFSADEAKRQAWNKGPYARLNTAISHYSNQWYVIDDAIALGIGSYGQYIIFNRNTDVAIAKFSTYPINPDYDLAIRDLAWLIERVQTI